MCLWVCVCAANICKKQHTLQNCTMELHIAPHCFAFVRPHVVSPANASSCLPFVPVMSPAPLRATPCSLTKSINTMQAQHDEGYDSEHRTCSCTRSCYWSRSIRGSCYVPTLSYIVWAKRATMGRGGHGGCAGRGMGQLVACSCCRRALRGTSAEM